jgi:hypothetical protein
MSGFHVADFPIVDRRTVELIWIDLKQNFDDREINESNTTRQTTPLL